MPEIEYIKDYEKKNGRVLKKGIRGHVTREKANELADAGYVTIVGSESSKATMERTAAINKAVKSKSKNESKSKSKKE